MFLPEGDILTGDSEGNILTWGRSLSDAKTPGRGGAKGMRLGWHLGSLAPRGFMGTEKRVAPPFFFFTVGVESSLGGPSRKVGAAWQRVKGWGFGACQVLGSNPSVATNGLALGRDFSSLSLSGLVCKLGGIIAPVRDGNQ